MGERLELEGYKLTNQGTNVLLLPLRSCPVLCECKEEGYCSRYWISFGNKTPRLALGVITISHLDDAS